MGYASRERQDPRTARRAAVKTRVRGRAYRYTRSMTDLLVIAVVLAFFALATLVVRGCQAIVGDSSGETESR